MDLDGDDCEHCVGTTPKKVRITFKDIVIYDACCYQFEFEWQQNPNGIYVCTQRGINPCMWDGGGPPGVICLIKKWQVPNCTGTLYGTFEPGMAIRIGRGSGGVSVSAWMPADGQKLIFQSNVKAADSGCMNVVGIENTISPGCYAGDGTADIEEI